VDIVLSMDTELNSQLTLDALAIRESRWKGNVRIMLETQAEKDNMIHTIGTSECTS
jgi:hypothetical protein